MANAHKNTSTITIVIPVYNEENYLKACLDSVASQTVKPDEVIVVDNNSTDRTVKIAKNYPFVRLLSEKQQGVTFARDKGFNAATSGIIGRIDADTVLPVDWVARVLVFFAQNPEVDAFSGPTTYYDLATPKLTLALTKIIRTTLFYAGRKDTRYLFGSNMAIRRTAWQDVAQEVCHARHIHEDNDLAIHLDLRNHQVTYTNTIAVAISIRRADTPLKDGWDYAFSEYRTYKLHGIFSIRTIVAGFVLLALHPGIKLFRRMYDPATGRYSLRRFRTNKPAPRPHPMA